MLLRDVSEGIALADRSGGAARRDLEGQLFKKLVQSSQVAGREEVQWATSFTNQAKNSLSRKSGFSPSQWVLGRDIRLPASLADDTEVSRIGAQAAADTQRTKFFRKQQIRMAAREAFARASNDSALRRAELRQVRPSRGPFPVGSYVFYYDAQNKTPSGSCWRGVARVIGKEGASTVWISHRGILVAVSPEHLSFAHNEEVEQWMVVAKESELIDANPAAGGSGFLDLRKSPLPPPVVEDGSGEEVTEFPLQEPVEGDESARVDPGPDPPGPSEAVDDLSSSSTSMARMRYEAERDARRAVHSSEFFNRRERERKAAREAKKEAFVPDVVASPMLPEDVPVGASYDPDLDDYRTPPATSLSPIAEESDEAAEREAKRQRVSSKENTGTTAADGSGMFCFWATEKPKFL